MLSSKYSISCQGRVARGAPNYISARGNIQVTRVRNADEFWQLYHFRIKMDQLSRSVSAI